jgi:hypothetical protein
MGLTILKRSKYITNPGFHYPAVAIDAFPGVHIPAQACLCHLLTAL